MCSAFIAALSIPPRDTAATNSPSFSPNRQKKMRIVSRIVSAKFSPATPNSRLSPRVSAYPHTAAMANASKNCFRKRTRICTQKKQSGESAPPRPIPAVVLPKRKRLRRFSLFVRTSCCCVRRKLFRDLRLVSHHNNGHLFRLDVFRCHFLHIRRRHCVHLLDVCFQVVFAQPL